MLTDLVGVAEEQVSDWFPRREWTRKGCGPCEAAIIRGCMCAAVRYEIAQAPLSVYACYCTDCQRLSSSVCFIGVIVPEDAFLTIGKEARSGFGGFTQTRRIK